MAPPPWFVSHAVGLAAAGVDVDVAADQIRGLELPLSFSGDEAALIRELPLDEAVRDRAVAILDAVLAGVATVGSERGAGRTLARAGSAGASALQRDTGDPGPAASVPIESLPPEKIAELGDVGAAVDRVWRRVYEAADVGELPPDLELAVSDAFSDELRSTLGAIFEHVNEDWVSFARHELRQPLAVVATTIETLLERGWGLEDDARQALLRRAGRQALIMQRILDQLRRAQHIDTGEFEVHPEEVDLEELVGTVVADFLPLYEELEIEVRAPHGPVTACVEPFAAAEILMSLLRNAVDHAPCDEPITVEVVPAPGLAMLAVHDDGPGIAPEQRERIFERGTRLNGAGELGLGLFIARGLARAHGGSLTVGDSMRLGGARFELLLPVECE